MAAGVVTPKRRRRLGPVAAMALAGIFLAVGGRVTPAVAGSSSVWGYPVSALVADPDRTGVVYAGYSRGGLLRTGDRGETWQNFAEGLDDAEVRDLALDGETGTLYAATDRGVYRRSEGAAAWERSNEGIPVTDVTAVAAVPGRAGHAYAGTCKDTLFRTEDGGATWRRVYNGESMRCVGRVAVDPRNLEQIFVVARREISDASRIGERLGVLTSRDAAETWSLLGRTDGQLISDVAVAAIDGDPWRIFVASSERGVVEFTHFGQLPWRSEGLPSLVGPRLLVDPHRPEVLFVGGRTGLFVSRRPDEVRTPRTWRRIGADTLSVWISALAADPLPGVLWAGSIAGAIYRSDDSGESWHEMRAAPPPTL